MTFQRVAVVMGVLLFVTAAAYGQLSAADVVALEQQGKSAGWTFTVGENPAAKRPLQELCGLVVPKDWRTRAPFKSFAAKGPLPAAWDWRSIGNFPPVKDQQTCGSCWAFATVGTFECAIRIKDGENVSLSEQWLISCNQETDPPHALGQGSWGCNGGWWAHDYHAGIMADPCGGSGAVLTPYRPYLAWDKPCECPYPHDYAMNAWGYIGDGDSVPPVDAIKQAILQYGPVTAAIYVDGAFAGYTGGVFNASTIQEVNHGIVLVGWDDSWGAQGAWILRNSWTDGWGEGGYMRIEYGCSNVGYGAAYVDYAGKGLGTPPAISRNPASAQVIQGWSHAFTVEAAGVGDLHYQWQHDGQDIGTDTSTLAIPRVTPDDAGTYTCRISDARGVIETQSAQLSVDGSQPVPALSLPAVALLGVALAAMGRRRMAYA